MTQHDHGWRIAEDRRQVLSADGAPVLVQGDAAWSLLAALTPDEIAVYLTDRAARGFNLVIVNLVEHTFAPDPPRTVDGLEPWLDRPFGTLAPDYAARALEMVRTAGRLGITVMAAPAYLGYAYSDEHTPAEGCLAWVLDGGVEGLGAWGRQWGELLAGESNVLWCIGGDRNPGEVREHLLALADGIRAAGASQVMTAHVAPEHTPAGEFGDVAWLDLNLTYSYGLVHQALQRDHAREPVLPFLLVESTYEGEHDASALQIRRQAWWSVLMGGVGHCMGNNPIWCFGPGWRDALDLPASRDLQRWGELLREQRWHRFRPDPELTLLTEGRGEARGLDRSACAITPERDAALIYLPAARRIGLDLSTLAGTGYRLRWFDPASDEEFDGGVLLGPTPAVLANPCPGDALLVVTVEDHR